MDGPNLDIQKPIILWFNAKVTYQSWVHVCTSLEQCSGNLLENDTGTMGMWLNRVTQNNHGWMTEARAAPQTTGPCHQGWWSFTTWKQKFSYSLQGTCQVRFLLQKVSWRSSWRLFAVQLEFHLLEVYVWIVVMLLGAPMGRLFGACNLEVFHWNKQRLFLGCRSSLAELFLHSLASLVDIVVS